MITSLPHTRSLLRRQSIFLCPKYLVNLSSVPSVWWLSLSLSLFVARPCSPTHFSLLVSVWLWPLTTLCSHNTMEERNKTTNYLNFSPLSCYLGGLIVGCWKSKTVKLAVDSDQTSPRDLNLEILTFDLETWLINLGWLKGWVTNWTITRGLAFVIPVASMSLNFHLPILDLISCDL